MDRHKMHITTFVTALIDLSEDRPTGKDSTTYLNNFKPLADTGLPFHVFISSSFEEGFKNQYSEFSNIHYDVINLNELETFRELDEIEFTKPAVIIEDKKQTLNYNILMNAKIEFVHKAIASNKHNLEQFAWIDFGISYVIKNNNTFDLLQNIRLKNKALIFPTIWNKSQTKAQDFNNINWRFAGGFFIGDRDSLEDFYQLYRKNFRSLVSSKKVLTWEVNMWAYLEEFCGFTPLTYSSDHNDRILQIPASYLKHESTIVTMFFNLKKLPDATTSVRPIEFYLEHGKKTLELSHSMVVFCDEETHPLIKKIRGRKPTTYVVKNITDYDYFKELYPRVVENRKVIPSHDSRNTSSYFLLCMFKIYAIHISKQNNYYPNTSHYFWVDFGGSHVMRGFDKICNVLDNPRPRIACGYIHYRSDSELNNAKHFVMQQNNTCIGGGFFSVEASYVDRFFNNIIDILNEQISMGIGYSDQQCIVYSYSRHPTWYTIYFADYYSLITNYHRTIEDIQCVIHNFINNARRSGRMDLVELAIKSGN